MGSISNKALREIRWAGLTRAQYVAFGSDDGGVWYGDRCGCFDDRCIGYHHGDTEPCHCLQVCIDQVLEDRDRSRRIAASPELTALQAQIPVLRGYAGSLESRGYRAALLALEVALGNDVPAYSWLRA